MYFVIMIYTITFELTLLSLFYSPSNKNVFRPPSYSKIHHGDNGQ